MNKTKKLYLSTVSAIGAIIVYILLLFFLPSCDSDDSEYAPCPPGLVRYVGPSCFYVDGQKKCSQINVCVKPGTPTWLSVPDGGTSD